VAEHTPADGVDAIGVPVEERLERGPVAGRRASRELVVGGFAQTPASAPQP